DIEFERQQSLKTNSVGVATINILMIEPYVDIDANIGDSTHVRELALNLSRSGSHVTLIARSSQNSAFSAPNLEFRNVSMSGRRSTGLDLPRLLSAVAALYVASGVLLRG